MTDLDGQGNPMERVEKAGQRGWKFVDGSILWDTGEREYPVSGKTDAEKRAEAMAEAGVGRPALKEGVSAAELAAFSAQAARLRDPAAILEARKAYAKKISKEKPPKSAAEQAKLVSEAPKSHDELLAAARLAARKLLNTEIDRCEELKALAGNSALFLLHQGTLAQPPNPPMQLHEAILAALKAIDGGNPLDMQAAILELRAWTGTYELPEPQDMEPIEPTKGTWVKTIDGVTGGQPMPASPAPAAAEADGQEP